MKKLEQDLPPGTVLTKPSTDGGDIVWLVALKAEWDSRDTYPWLVVRAEGGYDWENSQAFTDWESCINPEDRGGDPDEPSDLWAIKEALAWVGYRKTLRRDIGPKRYRAVADAFEAGYRAGRKDQQG